jgi:hypothetical protein
MAINWKKLAKYAAYALLIYLAVVTFIAFVRPMIGI